jgi:hypothetical protein
MVKVDDVVLRLNQRVAVVLTVAETSLPPERFRAFRKFMLDSFGWNGLAGDLKALDGGGRAK